MSNGYDKPPFGAPPPIFMQTGNQTSVVNEQVNEPETFPSSESYGEEVVQDVLGENPFGTPVAFGTPVTVVETQVEIPPFGSPPNLMDTPAPSQEKEKYKILDLFWLLNPKYSKTPQPEQPIQKEAHFVVLSFNINFGNLRISFFDLTQNSIVGNVAFLGNMKRTVSGTIYPMAAFNIIRKVRLDMVCMEQLFQDTGAEWQHSRPVCQIQKDEAHIRLIVRDPKFGSYFYDFIDTQKEVFLLACQYVYTKGFDLMAQNMLNTK